tara:strand:- start:1966 stop:2490 length:525 start_codon:yes stop_codon:yes gene_type:complete
MLSKVKTTLDFRKLIANFNRHVNNAMEDYAKMIEDDTIQGLETGRDVRGRKFVDLSSSAKKTRQLRGEKGTKPLNASGAMKNSISLSGNESKYKLKAQSYGNNRVKNAHQQGYVTKNNPVIKGEQFFFAGKRIPARPWWHNQDTVGSKRIENQFKELSQIYFKSFNKSLTKSLG